jgi:hypothetical protein
MCESIDDEVYPLPGRTTNPESATRSLQTAFSTAGDSIGTATAIDLGVL